mgnify:FL=1|tara:strand:+ start:6314 stop:7039 length:726 start_codon:yes stop_codon:yes gene_type:complete
MNYVVIILGVIVIILIYILVRVITATAVELTASANLNDNISAIEIRNSPGSYRYAYGLWIYVNSWDNGAPKTLYKRNNNIKLYLDEQAPSLKCDIRMDSGEDKSFVITDNFPLQKWVYIIVSVDNQYVDCYLDGKLVRSGRAYTDTVEETTNDEDETTSETIIEVPSISDAADNIKLGGDNRWDAYVTKFKHWSGPVNPETAHSEYLAGNGQSSFRNFFSRYGLDILIKKDDVEQTKLSIF